MNFKAINNTPKVTVGIPIYYGEIYLKETLENILSQDYIDYEIVITDNNPGGEPEKIAQFYADKYEHITYIKHSKKIGALKNWNSCIENAKGEYFIFAGAHDLWSEGFLSQLVKTIEDNPDSVLVYAPSYFMTSDGVVLKNNSGFYDTSTLSVVSRFNMVFYGGQEALYGLMRTSIIKKTRLQLDIVGSGAVWLGEISLFGHFIIQPEVKRYRRINRKESTREERLSRYNKTLFSDNRIRFMPFLRMYFAFFKIPFMGKISIFSRFRIFISVLINFQIRYGHDLILDLISFIKRPFIK